MRILKSLCRFKMCPDVKDSLVVKYLTFVKSCIQKVNLFIRYFSHKFNCLFARAMNSSISFLSVLHNQKILSMYLFHSRGLVFLRFSISVSTADIKMLAKVTAIFVPIGVPCVWRQFLLLNSNDRVLLKNKFKDSSEDWVGIGCFPRRKSGMLCILCLFPLLVGYLCTGQQHLRRLGKRPLGGFSFL